MNDDAEILIYVVTTESFGKTTKGPEHPVPFSGASTEVIKKEYIVLATSIAEAVQIVETSNAHLGEGFEEDVVKATIGAHITGGLSGSKYFVTPRPEIIAAAPQLLIALEACDRAFANWQLGQIPGRPEDILALITQVRAAISATQPSP